MTKGFAANFSEEKSIELAEYIFQVFEVKPPFNLKQVGLNFYFDDKKGVFA